MVNEYQINQVEKLMDEGEELDLTNYLFDEVRNGMNFETFDAIIDIMLSRVEQVAIQENDDSPMASDRS